MDNFLPGNDPPLPPHYDVEMVGDENNPEPIDARVRRPLEPLAIYDDEPMETRPVATVAPLNFTLSAVDTNSDLELPMPPGRRKESEIKSGYQVEAEEEADSLSMSDPYKGKGFLRLEITNFMNFVHLEADKQQRVSRAVWVRGLPWRILAIPRQVDRGITVNSGVARSTKALGFFLQCNARDPGEETIHEKVNNSWNCIAHAALQLVSKKEGGENYARRITHNFYPKENDWGYSTFMTCDAIMNDGFYDKENDTISLVVHVSAEAPHGVSWDSRKHTGFVGLKNQGATCYMNSILQTFFFTNKLRKAVYLMMISPEEDPENSVALAMQRVFYDLSHSDKPVGTKKLTKSFGWDSLDSFLQHDVQELCRVLLDNLETKMKGTSIEDIIPKLYKGKMCSYIKCTDVDYESAREEIFYDVQLNIRSKDPSRHGAPFSIIDSFRDYVEAETLDGDNKYDAGQFGLQPALKGIRFVSFPPILQFQLMRFQFDPNLESNVKVNDRFEFTDHLNLNEFIEKNEEGIDYTYLLHAVLVHSGDFHGGHYVVYINTDVKGKVAQWCKFDDDVVARSTFKESVVANFGGDDPEVLGRIYTNAYMLVYIRKDMVDEVLCDVTDEDIPRELIERFEADKMEEEKQKKEKADAHLYQNVYFITNDMIENHRGFDLFEIADLDKPDVHHKIEKAAPLSKLFSYVQSNVLNGENKMVEDTNPFRLWRFTENSVKDDRAHIISLPRFRATEIIPMTADTMSKEISVQLGCEKSIIYIERPVVRADGSVFFPPYNDSSDILVFLKYYDPIMNHLRFFGTIIVNFRASIMEAQPDIIERLKLPSDSKLRFYEEISPEKVKQIESPSLPLCSDMMLAEVNDGAIIVVERVDASNCADQTAKTYLDGMYNSVEVDVLVNEENNSAFPVPANSVQPMEVAGEPAMNNFCANIDLSWKCEKLAEFIGDKVGCPASHIMLWRVAAYTEKPTHNLTETQMKMSGFRVRELLSLTGDCIHDPRKGRKYKIFYNRVPVPIAELDKRRQMRITMMDDKFNLVDATVYPDKFGNVRHILEEARRVFKFSQEGTGRLRLVLVGNTNGNKRVMSIYHEDEPLSATLKYQPNTHILRVEEIPHDQLAKGINEFILSVAHFDKNPGERMFGTPFYLKVTEGESFLRVRERLRIKLELSEKEIEKYKFAILSGSRLVRYLDMDSDERVRVTDLQHYPRSGLMDVRGVANMMWLGLDHFNRFRGTEKARAEKAIVIHN